MNEYLIRTEAPEQFQDYYCSVPVGLIGLEQVLNVLHPTDPIVYLYDTGTEEEPIDPPILVGQNAYMIGGWDQEGRIVAPVDMAAYEAIRPLGNTPATAESRGGKATGILVAHGFAGWGYRGEQSLRELEVGSAYPATNNPFEIETRWKYFDDAWAGWGWRAELLGSAASRDPSVRAVAWYSDPQCLQYVATTGAFRHGPSEWQVDQEGQPLDVWFSETPAGFRKPDKTTPWHLAILWASIQEGYATLSETTESMRHLYWAKTQEKTQEMAQGRRPR